MPLGTLVAATGRHPTCGALPSRWLLLLAPHADDAQYAQYAGGGSEESGANECDLHCAAHCMRRQPRAHCDDAGVPSTPTPVTVIPPPPQLVLIPPPPQFLLIPPPPQLPWSLPPGHPTAPLPSPLPSQACVDTFAACPGWQGQCGVPGVAALFPCTCAPLLSALAVASCTPCLHHARTSSSRLDCIAACKHMPACLLATPTCTSCSPCAPQMHAQPINPICSILPGVVYRTVVT